MTAAVASDQNRARVYGILVLLLLVVGIFFRFYDLTGQSLWYDEGVSLEFSDGDSPGLVVERLGTTLTSERYQPLYFLLLHFWRQLCGSSEWALRSLSAILGVLALLVFVPVVRSCLDGRQRPAAIGFMALSSFAIYYSQEVRPYSLLILVCVLHWLLIGKTLEPARTNGRSKALLISTAAVSLLGGLTSLFFAFHLASAGGAWLLSRGKRPREWSFWIVSALALVPGLAFFALAGTDGGSDSAVVSRTEESILANAAFSVYGLLVGTTYGPPLAELRLGAWGAAVVQNWQSLLIFCIVCIGLFYSAVLALRSAKSATAVGDRGQFAYVLRTLGLGALVLLIFAYVTKLNWLPRHSTFLLPTLAIALGQIVPPADRGIGFRETIRTWSVAALLALNVFSLSHYFHDEAHRRGDYRGVAAFLRYQQPVPVVLLLGSPSLLQYYGAPNLLDVRWKPDPNKAELVTEYTKPGEKFLVVVNREDLFPGGFERAEELVKPLSSLERNWDFPAFRILEFSRRPELDTPHQSRISDE